jgi:hypothetical protein
MSDIDTEPPQPIIWLVSGSGPIAREIKRQTRSRWSHAKISIGGLMWEALAEKSKVICRAVEPNESGQRLRAIDHWRPEQTRALAGWLKKQEGKGYDYASVFAFVTHSDRTDAEAQAERKGRQVWFCSEVIFAGVAKCKEAPLARCQPFMVPPEGLWQSPLWTPETF